jgi:hypothetical protein
MAVQGRYRSAGSTVALLIADVKQGLPLSHKSDRKRRDHDTHQPEAASLCNKSTGPSTQPHQTIDNALISDHS